MDDRLPLKVLFVEDEPDLRDRIRIVLEMYVQEVITGANGAEGLELFDRERPDVVVSDIMMPVLDGLELSRQIRERAPETPIILSTAFTETSCLLKAIELGISAYLRKPLDCDELIAAIRRAAAPILQRSELVNARRREEASLELLLGGSEAMRQVTRQAQRIAATDFSLIIQGETGVGKSHLASLIHRLGRRRHAPFVTVPIGSLAESVIESQLFGHVKGAFTGAAAARTGLFEEADGGTLFLDDVDCAPPAVQAKILQAVEQKSFLPVGATKTVQVDVRVIAASNRDLLALAKQGGFREDLYYRLGDLVVTLPPLRERGEDIADLARGFLEDASLELDRVPPRMTADAVLFLNRQSWPGNVRELKSAMKRAALFAGDSLSADDLAGGAGSSAGEGAPRPRTLEEIEAQAVRDALAATGGKKMEAARLLDVEYGRFKRMLERFGL